MEGGEIMKKLLKGFTLIELMIVIAIIAILAAILIPSFIHARDQSKLGACESNLRSLGTSTEMYANDYNGNYPTVSATGAFASLSPTYLRSFPTCPSNYSQYSYTGTTNPGGYTYYSQGQAHSLINNMGSGFPEFSSKGGLVTR